MILQALYQLYERLLDDPNSGISPPGYSNAGVSFALNLSPTGELLGVIDLREQAKGRRMTPRDMDVPRQIKRTSDVSANFLCDNSGYVLGVVRKKGKPAEQTARKREATIALHCDILQDVHDSGANAVLRFLDDWQPSDAPDHPALRSLWDDLVAGGDNIVFKLDGEPGFIHERPAIRRAWEDHLEGRAAENVGQCLVTGENAPIARVHDSIKGVAGAKPTGAALVSFNFGASKSYHKEQNMNSPVSEKAAFGYVTALNYLIRSERHRIRIGDATTVFWAERSAQLEEDLFLELMNPMAGENNSGTEEDADGAGRPRLRRDPQTTRLVRDALARVAQGRPISEDMVGVDKDVRFYILGLSPNAARLSVRFWHVDTFGRLIDRIGQHYSDMAISLPSWETGCFPIWMIIKATAPMGDSKRASPLLAGALTRAILTGTAYPEGIYTALLARIRADQEVTPVQAAMIKACLVRKARVSGDKAKGGSLTVSLNEERTDAAYLLGRLFAWLEKVQAEATPELNATIRDRYFGAASATPRSVFPVLLRLAQHHIAKARYGGVADKQIEGIVGELDGFPSHLDLEEQGTFVLGYYHQRQAFYQKKSSEAGRIEKEDQR